MNGPAGTKLPSGAWVTSWTPPGAGSYTFWVVKCGDGDWNTSDCAGPYTLTVNRAPQPAVWSSNRTISSGQAFTPSYFGGAGNGNWQFVISNYTNWSTTVNGPAGTDVPGQGWSTSWTPPGPGSYIVHVAKCGDDNWDNSGIAGPYTLAVTAPTYSLSVISGSGSGSYTQGQTVSITANPPPSGQVFNTWSQSGPGSLANANASSTTFTMGAGNATVSATYRQATSAPTIISHPANQTVNQGQPVTFSVFATGTAPLSYQWRKNGAGIPGATNSSYTIGAAQVSDAGAYTCYVSNSYGSQLSNQATLTVNAPPTIVTQPVSRNAAIGSTTTFSVAATGTQPLYYQWYWNGQALTDATDQWKGWQTPTLNTTPLIAEDNGATLQVAVWNSAGTTWSNQVTLTVRANGPAITTQPVSRTAFIGDITTFSVVATSTEPLTYQWYWNNQPLTDETDQWKGWRTPTLTTTALVAADNGATLRVVVTDVNGNVSSDEVTLTVLSGLPTITTQPASMRVRLGGTATFSVVATGTPAPTYQWRKNGSAIDGATSASYTVSNAQPSDADTYDVVLANASGTVTSNSATLAVLSPMSDPVVAPAAFVAALNEPWSPLPYTSVPESNGTGQLLYSVANETNFGTALWTPTVATEYTVAVGQKADANHYGNVEDPIQGSLQMIVFKVNVSARPTITSHPVSQFVRVGGRATFSVTATASPAPTYQWRKDGVAIAGATNATYTIAEVQSGDVGSYDVAVSSNDVTVYSNPASLSVDQAPPVGWIDFYDLGSGAQAFDQTMPQADWPAFPLARKIRLSGWATDSDRPYLEGGSVKFYKEGAPLGDATLTHAANNAVAWTIDISTTALGLSDNDGWEVTGVVTDSAGQTYTMGIHFKDGVPDGSGPGIKYSIPFVVRDTGEPKGAIDSYDFGSGTALFETTMPFGNWPTSFATNRTVTLSGWVSDSDVGDFAGGNVAIHRAVVGTDNWSRLGTADLKKGANGAVTWTYTLSMRELGVGDWLIKVVAADAANKSAALPVHFQDNGNGSGVRRDLPFSVKSGVAPIITKQPESRTVEPGVNASFAVVVENAQDLTYTWQRKAAGGVDFVDLNDGGKYSGVTTSELTVSATTTDMTGDQFRCLVKNPGGELYSTAAILTVGTKPENGTLVISDVSYAAGLKALVDFSIQPDAPNVVALGDDPATYDITEEVNVLTGADVRYKVAVDKTIRLRAGFKAHAGSVFSAVIEGGTASTQPTQPPAPEIAGGTIGSGTVGLSFNYQVAASNNPTSYTATSLPRGLFINSKTGEIYGRPTESGTFTFTVNATNGTGTSTATRTITIGKADATIPGALAADVSVDNHGAANCTIPLATPPGRAGLQPKLALTYNSGAGNGPLGIGFEISTGFPRAITRGRSILARDGVVRGVQFDQNDKFYLDGKRLICVSGDGDYGKPNSVYRTEVDSFVTITAYGEGDEIHGFKLEGKDGLILCFGKDVKNADGTDVYSEKDGYQQAGGETTGQALSWALKWVQDRVGNNIKLTYDNQDDTTVALGAGEHVLTSIQYTGNKGQSVDPEFTVRFKYNEQNNDSGLANTYTRPDGGVMYKYGRQTVVNARLDRIAVFTRTDAAGATPRRSFTLKYDAPADRGMIRLVQVSRADTDVSGASIPTVAATKLNWGSQPGQLSAFKAYEDKITTSVNQKWQSGDFGATGTRGILVRKENEWRLVSSDGNGGLTAQSWGAAWDLKYWLRKTGDFNGDGRADLLLSVSGSGPTGGWYIALGKKGGGFDTPIQIVANYSSDELRKHDRVGYAASAIVADIDGDGLDDIMFEEYATSYVPANNWEWMFGDAGEENIFENEGLLGIRAQSATSVVLPNQPFELWLPKYASGMLSFQHKTIRPTELWGKDLPPVPIVLEAVDLNGDGTADFLASEVSMGPPGWGEVSINRSGGVLMNKGDATFSFSGFGTTAILDADYNMGSYSEQDPKHTGGFKQLVGDVNGDGLPDILMLRVVPNPGSPAAGWSVGLSKGDGTFDMKNYSGIPMQVKAGGVLVDTFQQRPGNISTDWAGTEPGDLYVKDMSGFDIVGATLFDYNGDGRKDFVWYSEEAGWQCILAGRNGFDVEHPISICPADSLTYYAPYGNLRYFKFDALAADVDGDGSEDLVIQNFPDVGIVSPASVIIACAFGRDTDTYRLLSVTDGLGASTAIAYRAITDQSIYTPGAGVSYPIRELVTPLRVVSDVWRDSGADKVADGAHFTYQYSGRRLDLSGRGELGFHSFVTLDQQTHLFKYQFLTQSFPMTGLTAREQTYRYWTNDNQANFRLVSSHDNTVVFDEVVKSAGDTTAWGSVYPFISKAVESRWEDAKEAHFTDNLAGASSRSELLFSKALPVSPHITITAKSWFDEQADPLTTTPGAYFASDTDPDPDKDDNTPVEPGVEKTTDRGNVVRGTANYATFQALGFDHKITYGNLRKLETDYGDGFTETVVTEYEDPVGTLTGRVKNINTTVHSPGYKDQTAPEKSYTYWGATPLVETETINAADNKLDLTTKYHRDGLGRVDSTTITGYSDANDPQHIGTYEASSVTSFDSRFDLPTLSNNAAPYKHPTTVQYHPLFASPTSVTDVNHATTTTAYDVLGRVLTVRDELKKLQTDTDYAWTVSGASDWRKTQTVTAPDGHTGAAAGGTITGVTAVKGVSVYAVRTTATAKPPVTAYFDRLGRVIRTIKEGFNTTKAVTDTVYNNLGQVIAVSVPYDPSNTATGPFWTKTEYDALGRVAKVTAPNGTVTTNTYNGRITSVTVDAPNLGGADPDPQTNTTLVDAKGRTVKVWNADNPAGSVSGTDGSGGNAASLTFDLDGFGRMRKTTLKGQTAQVIADYDELGRQTSLDDPDKGKWTYLNNALGEVVEQTDAKENVTVSKFDHLGRPLSRTTTEPASAGGAIETARWFYYDTTETTNANASLNLVEKGNQGWIGAQQRNETATTNAPGYANAHSGTGTVHYYDTVGRPLIDLTTVDDKWFYTFTSYDFYSRIKGLRYYWRPDGAENPEQNPEAWQDFGTTYLYDAKSYILSIADTTATPRSWWMADTNAGYDYLDRPVRVRKGNGHWTKRVYRPQDGVLTNIQTGSSSNATLLQGLTYQYDGLGNLRSRAGSGGNETLGYDKLNRLTSSTKQGAIEFSDNGNIRTKIAVNGQSTREYTYDLAQPHAVHTAFGYTMGYDANGNLESRTKDNESWTLQYAGFDKPRWMAKTADGKVVGSEFVYDANRSRTLHLEFDQLTAGAPSHYVRKRVYGLGSTLEINYKNRAVSGAAPDWTMDKVRIYVPGPDGVIGAREFDPGKPAGQQETPLVYHYDHLGSIDAVTRFGSADGTYATDTDGSPSRFSEDAWGQRRNPDTWSGPPTTTDDGGPNSVTPRGFTGHEMLDDLGLIHMNGRIYDPLLGRMLSPDVLVQFPNALQSYNRYSYVENNPLTHIDPTGFMMWVGMETYMTARHAQQTGRDVHQALQEQRQINDMVADKAAVTLVGAGAAAAAPALLPTAATAGLGGAVLTGAVSGAAAGAASTVADNALNGRPIGQDVGRNTVIGGATGGLFGAAGHFIGKLVDRLTAAAPKTGVTPQVNPTQPPASQTREPGKKVFRELSKADRAAYDAGEPLQPKGTGGSILDHVRGKDTGHISASETEGGTARFAGGNGLAEIDVNAATARGTKLISHADVIEGVGPRPKQIEKVTEAQEVLFDGPVPANAINIIERKK